MLAEQGVTRVSVRTGGVIVSGLGGGCLAEGVGPCEGNGSAELFANMANARDKMLQFRAGDPRPQLVDVGTTGPDRVRPPTAGEPVASKAGQTQDVTVAEARNGGLVPVVDKNLAPGTPQVTPPPVVVPDIPVATWGRWQTLISQPTPVSIDDILKNRSLVGLNSYYALGVNPAAVMDLPGAGAVDFKLTASEGFFVAGNGTATPSTASNGTLRIDFGTRRFQTGLDLTSGVTSTRIEAQGPVDPNGTFASDLFVSQSKIIGVVGNQATGAGYIYQRAINDNLTAVGGTTWRK